jgi:hypothetical protein
MLKLEDSGDAGTDLDDVDESNQGFFVAVP